MESRICALDELPEGQGRGFYVSGRELVVVRRAHAVFAYENRCPHRGTSLDWAPNRFMSPDGAFLACATHGALFRVEDGACIAGPCMGQGLTPVPCAVVDGVVQLAAPPGR